MKYIEKRNLLGFSASIILLFSILTATLWEANGQSCSIGTLPYRENFESYNATPYGTAGIMPTCWDVLTTGSQARYYPHVSYQQDYAYDGNYLLMSAATHANFGSVNYSILPSFDADLNELHIAFDTKMQAQFANSCLILGYFSDIHSEATFVALDTIQAHTNVVSYDISLYHRGIPLGTRLAFKWVNTASISLNCFIDNVLVDFEECIPVSNLQLDSVLMNTAKLSWTSGHEESMWRVEYGTSGYVHGQEDTAFFVDTTTVYLTDLQQGKKYDVYVQSVCYTDNWSAYSDSLTFTSYCFELGDTTTVEMCGTYEWHGKTYYETGIYYDTVSYATPLGCDSIYTLDVILHPIYNQYDTLIICDNELPYSWRDTLFQADAADSDFVFYRKAVFDCDSIVHLHVLINPTYYREDTVVICQNDLPFTYAEHVFPVETRTGSYPISLQSQTGCDSVIQLQLFVHQSYFQSEVVRICQQDLPYTWRDTIFNEGSVSDVYTFYRTSCHGCDSIVSLSLIIRPSYHEEEYLTICRSELPYQWRNMIFPINTVSGTMTISNTTAFGCDSVVDLYVTVLDMIVEEETLTICEQELPLVWHDTIFMRGTSSGTYEILRDNGGCGKKSVLHLTVIHHPITYLNYTICPSDFPYTVSDTTFSEGTVNGTYILHRTSSKLCDSVISIRITVLEAEDVYETIDLCSDDFPREIHDTIFGANTVSGDYVLRRYTLNGCLYRIYLHLNVHTTTETYDTLEICATELPAVWMGHVIARGTESGDYVFAEVTAGGCDSVHSLHLVVYPSYRLSEILVICENELPYQWRDIVFDETSLSGVYYYERVSSTGCDSLVFLQLIINESKYLEESLVLCDNEFPYAWRDTVFQNSTLSGDYTFSRYTMNGCDSVVTLHLTVNSSYEQEEELSICSRDLPYIWRDVVFDENTESGYYTFNRHSMYGCDSIVHLNLTVYPSVVEVVEDTLCESSLPAAWRDTIFYQGTTSGTYTFYMTNALGCDSTVVLHLTVNPLIDTTIPLEICVSDLPYVWEAEDYTFPVGASSGSYPFHHTSVLGCDSVVHLNLTIHPEYDQLETIELCENDFPYQWRDTLFEEGTLSGEYLFSRQSQYGCDSIVSLMLIVKEIPEVQILGDTNIMPGQSVMLVATYGVGNMYEWDNGTQGNILSVTPDTTTTYYLTVTNNVGCNNVFSITIHVATHIDSYEINKTVSLFPNPTDGFVHVQSESASIIEVSLYNMQGALIHRVQSNDRELDMDYAEMVPGVYMLMIKLDNQMVVNKKLIIR